MSIVGETTGALGLLSKAWGWVRDRFDPARVQAQRLIQAFEAYGIARQQIPRLMPAGLTLPNAAFSSPGKLKAHVTPALLDWAAEHLAIHRSWLDGVGAQPHLIEDHYKAVAGYRDWLAQRIEQVPLVHRLVHVWKPESPAIGPDAFGPVCLVYEETSEGLDGAEFSRFWRLSDEWPLEHPPCVENMIAVAAIARSLGILVVGHELALDDLRRLTAGKALIPDLQRRRRGRWHPEDLIEPLAGQDSAWRQARWEGARTNLHQAGIHGTTPEDGPLPNMQPDR
jgi:hypothetical protein